MGKLRIYLGQAGSGKTEALFKDCLDAAAKDFRKNFIVIVPEQVSHAVTGKLLRMSERQAIMNIDVLSFVRLAHRIFDNAGNDDREIIDDTGKNLILKTVINEHADELAVLGKKGMKSGYINEIKSIISEFVQYEISPEDVEKMSEFEGRSLIRTKLKDLSVLYKAFREKLEEKYVTKEELLDRAAEAVERADFLKGADIYLDDFTGFTPIQYRFLSALFKTAENVSLCLNYDGKDGKLFELSVNTIAKIRSVAEEEGFEIKTLHFYENRENRFKDNPCLSLLERNLFRERRDDRSLPSGIDGDASAGEKTELTEKEREAVSIIKCDTPEKESAFIISEIMRLVREEGMRYRDIGIVMSDPERYGRLLNKEAEEQGVSLFLDSTSEILLNPYTEFIRSALEMIRDNMTYETVFHFLRTGLSDMDPEDIDRLENYVRAFNIRGYSAYKKEFLIHTGNMEEEDLIRVNAAREKLVLLIGAFREALSGGKKKASFLTEELIRFIDLSKVKDRIGRAEEALKKEEDLKASMIYSQIPEKVDHLLSRIALLIPDEEMDITEYLEILNAGFESIRIGTLPAGMDAVKAGDMTRSRLNDIRVLFFAGMNDGSIPEVNSGSGILSDLDREFLMQNGVTLSPAARERIGLNKLYFYMSVTKPSEKLYLTYSLGNSEGQVLRPSFFLKEVEGVIPGIEHRYIGNEDIRKRFLSVRDALLCFSDSLGDEDRIDEAGELYSCISAIPEHEETVKYMLDSAFRIHGKDAVSRAVSRALYGDLSGISPTRLERFAECAYRHFMSYGLRAMEREEFGFERSDLGRVLHEVLNICGVILSEEGKTFSGLTGAEAEELSQKALDCYLRENENIVLLSSERNKYFVKRISRIINTTVRCLTSQGKKGAFNPESMERSFNYDGMRGRIDRIDTAVDGQTVYVSVIDYKSGNKDFDPGRIYYGLDLQLAVYLNGAMEIEKLAYPDREVKPAGIFYYHIDDPVIRDSDLSEGTDDEVEKERLDLLRLRGIVNSDPEVIRLFDSDPGKKSSVIPVSFNKDGSFSKASSVTDSEGFRVISDYVRKKAAEFRERIEAGEIDPSPAVYNGRSACDLCGFGDCCAFSARVPGFKERRLKKFAGNDDVIKEMTGGDDGS